MIYLGYRTDRRSTRCFGRSLAQLGVDIHAHMPKGSDGRRVDGAEPKSKVERP